MQKSASSAVSAITALWLGMSAPAAHASCSSTNCFLVTGTQDGIANPGQLIMDLSYRFIPMSRAQQGSEPGLPH